MPPAREQLPRVMPLVLSLVLPGMGVSIFSHPTQLRLSCAWPRLCALRAAGRA